MAASQDGLVTLRVVVCGGGRTYLSLVGCWPDTVIRDRVFETRDALFAGWLSGRWAVVWSAEPVVLLRLAVVLVCAGCCWMEGTNQDEQAQRPIMMRAPKTYERAWTGKSARHCSCLGATGPVGRKLKLKLKHVGRPGGRGSCGRVDESKLG